MRVILKVLAGPYNGQEFTFDQHDTFLIGRSENAHLYLPEDRFFSRHHCLLEIAPPRCFLRDLGSTNGTFVNGKRVQEVFLQSGDRVQGGQTVLEVEVQADQKQSVGEAPTLMKPIELTVDCVNCGRREKVEGSATNERMPKPSHSSRPASVLAAPLHTSRSNRTHIRAALRPAPML